MRRAVGLLFFAACIGGCADTPPGLVAEGDGGSDTDVDSDTGSDSDSDTDTDADADAGSDAGPAGPCTETHELFLSWLDAVVTEPMVMAQNEDPALHYIFTEQSNLGTAVAPFDVPCDDVWYVWGIAQTGMGLPATVPNTFYAQLDEFAEALWNLQVDALSSGWVWNQGGTDGTPWAPEIGAGPHALTIRGGEEDLVFDLPKLGTVVFVNDPAWTP